MVRTHLVPTIMSIRLLGPRLLVAKFRGAQRNLTVYVAHAPHSGASDDDRQAFYPDFSEAFSDRNEMDTTPESYSLMQTQAPASGAMDAPTSSGLTAFLLPKSG